MFDIKIPLYGIFIFVAIISGLFVIYNNIKVLKYKKEEIIGLLIYILLGAVFGGKYFTFITSYQKFGGVFSFSKIGLSSYGGILGILIMAFIFSKQYKKQFMELLYAFMPAIPLMYAIGKIGCYLAGCCYGIEYNGIFNVVYNYSYSAPKGVSLFPIQLLESIIFFIIFICFYNIFKKKKYINKNIGLLFIICGIFKFLLDYLRMSHVEEIISINQILCLVFIFIGVFLVFKDKERRS